MIVSDIKADAAQVLGFCTDPVLYNRLTYAVEALANKGNWDALLGYLDITVSGSTVTLPEQVETPIRLNINGNPSFTRSKIYEFTLNGPGNDMSETTGYSWMDKGTVPTLVPLSLTTSVKAVSSSASDNGKKLIIAGLLTDGTEVSETLVLNSTTPPVSVNSYTKITKVSKDATVGTVSLKEFAGTLLSTYSTYETEPQYRQIRLSKPAAAVRMLFRRRTFTIASDDDFIPLNNRMAILLMLKSLEAYRRGSVNDLQDAKGYEDAAVQMCKEEQDSRTGFDVASSESQTPLDLSYNNIDSIIVADIYDDIAKILGPVGKQKVLDFITETYEALLNKGQWDGISDGYVDIVTDCHEVVLPRYVEVPLAVNLGGTPATMRNKWFEFHLNGPGSNCGTSCSYWDDLGDTVTLRDVDYSQQLEAIADDDDDNGLALRVYGFYEGKWIQTEEDGVMVDGFPVEVGDEDFGDSQYVDLITRITKPESKSFITLKGWDSTHDISTIIGYYYPDETVPNYRKIRVPSGCQWVRMRYRRKDHKFTSLTDPMHLKSKLAIMCMARAVFAMGQGKIDQPMEDKAMQYLSEEQNSRNPAQTISFQFNRNIYGSSPEHGQY